MHLGAQAWVIRELFKIDITRIAGAVVSTDASKNNKKILDISYSGVFKDYVELLWGIRYKPTVVRGWFLTSIVSRTQFLVAALPFVCS